MLARQQVVVDRLPEQSVPEAVAGLVSDQYGGVDRLSEGLVELGLGLAGRRLQQLMVDPVAGNRRDLEGVLGNIGKRLDPDIQGVAEGVGHVDAAASRGGGQLLHEVRNALAAPEHQVGHGVGGVMAEQQRQQFGDLAAVEAGYVDPYGLPEPADLGQEGAQRVPPGQLIRTVGGDDHDRRVGQRPGHEPQQVPGRVVCPVDVLHDHHQRSGLAGPLPKQGHGLEQLQPQRLAGQRRADQIRQQGTQRRTPGTRPVQDLIATVPGDELAKCADDWCVRQPLATHRHALAVDHLGLAVGERAAEVGDERVYDGRLACPGVAADDDEPAPVGDHVVQQLPQPGALLRPTDDAAGPPSLDRSSRLDHKHYRATRL